MATNCGPEFAADRQVGNGDDDWLIGGDGDDTLYGRGGDDLLDGGAGDDRLRGNRDDDQLNGDDGNDWLHGGHGDDELFGGAGRDRLFGHFGDDRLEGGAERDHLHGGRGEDFLSGGDGDDRLQGGRGNDLLDGGVGDDKAHGGKGDDVFVYRAGDGNDFFHGERGADTIRLDSVADGWTLHLSRGKVVVADDGDHLDLSTGARGFITFADGSQLRFRSVERIETVPSEPAQDKPVQPNQAPGIVELTTNGVFENAADGTVVGMVAATDPDAGEALTYALLDDAGGRFTIDATSGTVVVADGALLDYETADRHSIVVQVTDAGGLSDTATFSIAVQFDNSGDDALTGDGGDNVIDGGPGNDHIYGQDGNDHLIGSSGNDTLMGGDGDDVLEGGDGDDVLNAWIGSDQLSGGAGNDMLFGDNGDDWLSGGGDDDQLFGGLDHDRIEGGGGGDKLFGNAGNDVLNGDAGDDTIFGSLGEDVIAGGPGVDTLSGGGDGDRFVFDGIGEGVDVITDFESGDVLAVGNVLTGFSAGQETDFVRLVDDGTDTTVEVDVDGAANGSAFESIAVLSGITGTTVTELASAGQIDFWPA